MIIVDTLIWYLVWYCCLCLAIYVYWMIIVLLLIILMYTCHSHCGEIYLDKKREWKCVCVCVCIANAFESLYRCVLWFYYCYYINIWITKLIFTHLWILHIRQQINKSCQPIFTDFMCPIICSLCIYCWIIQNWTKVSFNFTLHKNLCKLAMFL